LQRPPPLMTIFLPPSCVRSRRRTRRGFAEGAPPALAPATAVPPAGPPAAKMAATKPAAPAPITTIGSSIRRRVSLGALPPATGARAIFAGVLAFRALSVVHVVAGVLSLPLALFFGLAAAPVLALAPLWMIYLGIRLWTPNDRIVAMLRTTHRISLAIAALLILYGISALRAAERSAAHGGGLLGAFGILPLGLGIILGAVAGASLFFVARRSAV